QKLYDWIPELDGFIYQSHQVQADCIVLLQAPPKRTRAFVTTDEIYDVRGAEVRTLLNEEASSVNAVDDFGDPL
ncbi:MAG TPA: hypothetical protein VMG12_24995, partial [Polyangiaceae bacterium]|nr:hypothetical protein [Polyangiaceae bacterium]